MVGINNILRSKKMKLISKVTSAIVVFCLLISMVVVNVNAETLAVS